MTLTPHDVSGASFRKTRIRTGYDQTHVRVFLDRVAAAMRDGQPIEPLIAQTGFTRARFRAGYSPDDVDAFLEILREWAPPPPTDPAEAQLSAQDIRDARFRVTKLQPGYAQPEVDAFLDEIAAAVQAGHDVQGRIRAVAFTEVRWQEGYHPRDVDAFLDQLVE